MSDLWGVDVTHWWLPNDEDYPPVIRALRDFINFRAESAAKEPDAKDADVPFLLKDMCFHSPLQAL